MGLSGSTKAVDISMLERSPTLRQQTLHHSVQQGLGGLNQANRTSSMMLCHIGLAQFLF
jgi:hypothetical protein